VPKPEKMYEIGRAFTIYYLKCC